jgi:hypothetical protein
MPSREDARWGAKLLREWMARGLFGTGAETLWAVLDVIEFVEGETMSESKCLSPEHHRLECECGLPNRMPMPAAAVGNEKTGYEVAAEWRDRCKVAEAERDRLRAAIRTHRDQRGDDRCWLDDEELYRALPEGHTPPARDSAVELALCEKFIACRHNPATEYVSPQRRIEELEAELAAAREMLARRAESAAAGNLREFVSQAYCVACDSQALLRLRTDLAPTHSPMPELAGLEKQAGALLDQLRGGNAATKDAA